MVNRGGNISLRGRKKKPRRSKAAEKLGDLKHLGEEPLWTNDAPSEVEMMQAFSWYNYFYSSKDALGLLYKHYDGTKENLRLLKKLPHTKVSSITCFKAAMMARGCKLPKDSKKRYREDIKRLLKRAESYIDEEEKEEKPKAEKPNPQQYMHDQISGFIAELEEQLDLFTKNYESDFDLYMWLQVNDVKSKQANAISTYYKPVLAEFECIDSDSQVREAYDHMTDKQIEAMTTFVRTLVEDSKRWSENQKKTRQARVKKPQSVEKQVSKLNFLKEFKEFKLVSVNPAEIVGASQLWVFNAKYRKLTRFDARGPAGLSVKGSTLHGFDAETSIVKTIRKPEETLKRVLEGGKLVMRKIMDELTTNGSAPHGRINKDTILLKVIR